MPILISQIQADLFQLAKHADDLNDKDTALLHKYVLRAAAGKVFLDKPEHEFTGTVVNINFSRCYSCDELTIWNRDRILFPLSMYEIEPNDDLPQDIKTDFNEARSILDLSPRGAAALLRLAVQKLCMVLGKPGKDINSDIASLVEDGLNTKIQKALDIVRVVGNEAVHPGQMNLRDDRETASKLFSLVNKIAYDMITHPKELDALYNGLPQSKLEGIEKRDGK